MAGLAERDRERELCLELGKEREVVDAFVEEEVGETTEIEEEVDALEILRPRCWMP